MPETVITICLIAMFLIGYVLGRIHGSRWWNDA